MSKNAFLYLGLASSFFLSAGSARAAQMNYGKYFGTIQMDGQTEVMAVSLDAFVTQMNDPTVYPALDVIVRVNLGGYTSSEYVGYNFYDPTFNFEKGTLELNDPENELTASLQVTSSDTQTILEGPVTQRLTNTKGKMRVTMDNDDMSALALEPTLPFLSVLKGEYQGTCGPDRAELQIETARGLGATAPGNALSGYSITGRLGSISQEKRNEFFGLYPFSSGAYSPFTNRLTMQGPLGSLVCTRTDDNLKCASYGYDKSSLCTMTKKAEPATPPVQIPTGIYLNVPSEQKTPLPVPLPPGNEDLVSALDGDFYGFLHYENRDVYQLIEMSVVATTSTENPHIQNQVMVEPTLLLRLGSSWESSPALSLFYPQRVFGMNAGFAFQSVDSDYLAVIGNWRHGYVSGVMYSRSYGRVGTFEMQKGVRAAVPSNMVTIPDPTGQFRGPRDAPGPLKNLWSLEIGIPNQATGSHETGVPLLGRYVGPGVAAGIDAASLDLNAGSMSFLIRKPAGDRLVTGEMDSDGKLKLLWPVGPALGAPMVDYELFSYLPSVKNSGSR